MKDQTTNPDNADLSDRLSQAIGVVHGEMIPQEARERVLGKALALRKSVVGKPCPKRGIIPTLKEALTMPRTWIGTAVAAVLLVGVFFLWHGAGTTSLLAQSTQALRDVKSYQCRFGMAAFSPPVSVGMTGKFYWAQGSLRLDSYEGDKLIWVRIMPKDKPGLEIDHRLETFERLEPMKGSRSLTPMLIMGKLADYSGQADRPLEKRQIGGIAVPGFEITLAKIDPGVGEGKLRVWIDPEAKLPLHVEVTLGTGGFVCEDFQWNVPTGTWFNVEPPAKYQDKTPTTSSAGS
jgi:outer membrane lipoprotein-sorting protein